MTLNLNVPTVKPELSPRITVIGVGGAGGNAVNNMIQTELEGVEFLIANSDSQAIAGSLCNRCIQLGRNITQGLGAGSRPDIGRAAAEEAMDEIVSELETCNMVFVTAGMGGGTGTGAAPVIARAAREAGILTVGVVTKPFHFEGVHRMRLAEAGINELTQYVDTLIIIPNQNLFRVANEKTTFADAFKMADDVLNSGVRGVTDLMVNPGLINLDFADIRSVMSEMGKAMMGTGEAEGEHRALGAAEAAISNPLLDDVSMKGARGVLINITGGLDLTLFEVDEAANRIRDEVDPEANIVFGSTFDPTFEGKMRVSVVATGIDADAAVSPRPVSLSLVSETKSINLPEAPVAATASVKAPQMDGGLFGGSGTAQALAVDTLEEPAGEIGLAEAAEAEERLEQEKAEVASEPCEPAAPELGEPTAPQPDWESGEARQPADREPSVQVTVTAPRASVTDDGGFIAPRPLQADVAPQLSPEASAGHQPRAEPFAEAALANAARPAAPEGGRKSSQSLFARMTGGASRVLQAATSGGETAAPDRARDVARQEPTAEPQRDSAPLTAERPATSEPVRAQPVAKPAPQPLQQAPLSGLERKSEEEMLDIPAFLRRQAN